MNVHSHDRQSNLIDRSIASSQLNLSSVISWMQNVCNNHVYYLVHGDELKVWQKCDRFGSLYWYAHDPKTGRSITRASENEVRIWLESILYR